METKSYGKTTVVHENSSKNRWHVTIFPGEIAVFYHQLNFKGKIYIQGLQKKNRLILSEHLGSTLKDAYIEEAKEINKDVKAKSLGVPEFYDTRGFDEKGNPPYLINWLKEKGIEIGTRGRNQILYQMVEEKIGTEKIKKEKEPSLEEALNASHFKQKRVKV